MFIARVEIFDQRRSEERNPTRPSARKHISAPPNAAGGVCSSSYKHATPNGVKPVTLFFTASESWWIVQIRPVLHVRSTHYLTIFWVIIYLTNQARLDGPVLSFLRTSFRY